ncbi:hypothetical protein IZY60_06510 [Lutibacter sp. B2]|nr:hypothetical protein [Lutibacter sp. B2]
MNKYIIKVNFFDNNSIEVAIKTFIKLLKSDVVGINGIKEIEFRDNKDEILTPSILTRKKLLTEIIDLTPKFASELLFILKLIELDMEDQVTDIGWEIYKLAKKLKDPKKLITIDGFFFGTDILYAIGRTWPTWSYIMGKYIQKDWTYEEASLPFNMMENILLKDHWNKDMVEMFINCDSSIGRKLLAKHDLKYYLGVRGKFDSFKKVLGLKLKDAANSELVEEYFRDADINYSVKDIQGTLKVKKNSRGEKISFQVKGYVLEKNVSQEVIELKYILALAEEEESVFVKVNHPPNKEGETLTKWRFSCKDGAINNIKWVPENEGVYVFTIVVKGKPLIKERILLAYPKESKIEVLEDISYTEIINYGVYGFNHDHKEGHNISLTPQRLDRKPTLGSYFGITYNLNKSIFKGTINVKCKVQSKDEYGNLIIDESWDDIAYAHKANNFVYIIEKQCELREGPWIFTLVYEEKIILEQRFNMNI